MAPISKQAQAIIDFIAATDLSKMELLRMKHKIEEKMIEPDASWPRARGGLRGPFDDGIHGGQWFGVDARQQGHSLPRDSSAGSSRQTHHGQRHQNVDRQGRSPKRPPNSDGINAIGEQVNDMTYLNNR